jgi:indolepyruvate ferredoxin oxidoreductase, beta subunit
MKKNISILIVGVGGQGTLLTSRILGDVAMKLGYDVKMSELHGMAQRGGSVVTYVRMGDKVSSPIIEKNSADVLLAFEELEALRWLDYLKEDGFLILNTQKIDPMPVIMRKAAYPEGIVEKLQAASDNIIMTDALGIAREIGNIKVVNVVMLGKLAKVLDMKKNIFEEAIRNTVPEKFLALNLKAFDSGYN